MSNSYRRRMETLLKRPLLSSELVHHINGNHHDHRSENLQLVTPAEHRKLHPDIWKGISTPLVLGATPSQIVITRKPERTRDIRATVSPIKVLVRVQGKRPDYATPAYAKKLRADGKSVIAIAKEWGISRAQVYNILNQP